MDRYVRNRDWERGWRRFDEDEEFDSRPGALDRHWGYGNRLASGSRARGERHPSEFEHPDEYNAPDYWVQQQEYMRGPHRGVGPRGYRRPDARILDDVCMRLTQHAQIDASDIEVEVEEAEVTLSGTVADRRQKRMVEANVERIAGVVDIHNRLRLRKPETFMERARKKTAREMAEKFPGGDEPSGPAV
jgi:hypothetical protein